MNYAIITGASKRLGAAIGVRMLKEKAGIVSIARTENEEFKEACRGKSFILSTLFL